MLIDKLEKFNMKLNIKSNLLLPSALLCAIFFIASCNDEEILVESLPSNSLLITGPENVYVGDTKSYYLLNNTKSYDYTWSIGSGATITENSDNDAYVDVLFSSPGSFDLGVSNDANVSTGLKGVTVSSREVSFATDSVYRIEGIENDTVSFPLLIDGGYNGNFTYTYTISGDLTEGVDYTIVPGYESPITATSSSLTEVKVVFLPESDADADLQEFILEITGVSSALADEYFLTDDDDLFEQSKIVYANDLKVASLDTATISLPGSGIYDYWVSVSSPVGGEDVTVNYSITAGVGVTDATATNTPGQLVFTEGETSKKISLSVSPNAFSVDQTIEISLTSLVSTGTEAMLDDELTSKTLEIEAVD